MKRILCLLLCLCVIPLGVLAEDSFTDTGIAQELDIVMMDGRNALEQDALRDGDDSTGNTFKRGTSIALTATIPEETPIYALYLKMDTLPASVQLQQNIDRKWTPVAAAEAPFTELILRPEKPVTGDVRLVIAFERAAACTVTELRFYGDGLINERLHAWENGNQADVLILCDALENLDRKLLTACLDQELEVAVRTMVRPTEGLLSLGDELWEAGLRQIPQFGGFAAMDGTADQILKKWVEKLALAAVTGWIRQTKPLLVLTCGKDEAVDVMEQLATKAADKAKDYLYEEASAGAYGIWVVPAISRCDAVSADKLAVDPAERNNDAIRALCRDMWADAVHGDPAEIPYPAERLTDGYLAEGEFVYENEEKGLWAYLSPTVQVEIVKYEQPDVPRVWFETELHFKPEAEKLQQVLFSKASFKDQQTYPETLAQNANLVLGINGDYYPYRINNKTNTGNILRNYVAMYDYNARKPLAYPNLDTMALNDDGTMTVYDVGSVTATELAETGTVHDALSFGPWLVRDGKLRTYAGPHADDNEPRSAIGMVEAGHYWIITAEGKIPKGPKGISINQVGTMLYGLGANEAFNLDGGSTAVLIFMGAKLNRTGKGSSIGSPRNMHELFGVGTSSQTHTDMLNGK